MTLHLGSVPAGTTLYIPFASYDSNGASVTLTGLAVTDIEIYKNGSTTQRSSDAGYALLDTDGIDFDSVTGLHGFSIDLNDNTDAGFFSAGAFYWVVVSAVTIDTRTVTFIAATFWIGPQQADVRQYGGTAGTFASGRPEVNTSHVAGTAQTAGDIIGDTNDIQTRLPTALVGGRIDASVGAMAANVLTATAINADAITAAKIATGAIDADAIAADAVTEIQAGLSTLTAAQVNAEVVDALATDTYAEPSAVPAATASIEDKIGWLFALARNRVNQTSTTATLRNDANGANIATATVSDDGTTAVRAKWV